MGHQESEQFVRQSINLLQHRTQAVGDVLTKTGKARIKKATPHVLRFIGKRCVGDKEFPRKMLERPAVGFGKLMLRERNRLKITLFGGAVTSVWQSEAKGSLIVQGIGSVPDEGSCRAVGIV